MFQEKKDTGKSLLAVLWAIFVLLFILMVGLCWYFFDVKNGQKVVKNDAKELVSGINLNESKDFLDLSNTDPEVGGVVEKASKHILLPAKEITVATVNNAGELRQKNADAFKYVKNGDKLLIFKDGFIIYDQVVDKIVDVVHFSPEEIEKNVKQ